MRTDLTARDLIWFRVGFACYALTTLPSWTWASTYPDVMFAPPPGPLMLLDGAPSAWVLDVSKVGLVIALVLLVAGRWVGIASVAFTALWIFGAGVTYSFGKIDHDILYVLTPFVLLLAGWSGRRPPSAVVMRLWAFAIALAMLSAGLVKILVGWLDPTTQAVRGSLVTFVHVDERSGPLADIALQRVPGWAWEPADWAAVALECGLLLCVWSDRWFRRALALLCLFHLAVWLLFGISFMLNVVAYAAFVPWSQMVDRARGSRILVGRRGRRTRPRWLMARRAT